MKKSSRRRLKFVAVLLCVAAAAGLTVGLALVLPRRTIPILMYHGFTEDPSELYSAVVSIDMFEQQMSYLKDNDYTVLTVSELARLLSSGQALPPNAVVLTFDDGYEGFYDLAYPVLQKNQLPGTAYLYVDGMVNGGITWDEARQLTGDGLLEVGSHGISHHMLPLMMPEEIITELIESRLRLESELDVSVETFCYPIGALTPAIARKVEAAGYAAAVGTTYQRGEFAIDDRYVLQRVMVTPAADYPLMFRFMVSGYYVPVRQLLLKVLGIRTPRKLYADGSHD
jgi:peptidoglycan/xylan/chitin deacetylase (PgdA/CDA1 family)